MLNLYRGSVLMLIILTLLFITSGPWAFLSIIDNIMEPHRD